ncbi:MAG TPA: 2-amino-4-hydroxy-6-hydroxymethyldihydropteridine diphosphokinase [Rudaea sp.]|jgi:2-amino-4-hydroxy-6-hydroxymethyldihydropteridine diphosphokinase|nr:2-amino-4-hydroxy-6-hydroxymethyldihydropteridine diphosphokinase [Rudaea sp.]
MENVYIGLGSNLADPSAQVTAGSAALAELPATRLVACSRLYGSAPWGRSAQPEFVNAAAHLETALPPRELLDLLLAIERAAGRVRDGTRWGPRVLDLDILVYGDRVLNESGLHVPHPHLHERAFVLVPLAEIAPELDIPGHGNVSKLLASVDVSSCVRMAE